MRVVFCMLENGYFLTFQTNTYLHRFMSIFITNQSNDKNVLIRWQIRMVICKHFIERESGLFSFLLWLFREKYEYVGKSFIDTFHVNAH